MGNFESGKGDETDLFKKKILLLPTVIFPYFDFRCLANLSLYSKTARKEIFFQVEKTCVVPVQAMFRQNRCVPKGAQSAAVVHRGPPSAVRFV